MAITNAVCIAHIGLPVGVACFLLTMQTLAVRTSANHGSWDGKPSAHYSSERQHKSRHWVWRSACARFPTLPALVVLIDFVGRLYSASQELRRPPLLLSNLGFPAASERRDRPAPSPPTGVRCTRPQLSFLWLQRTSTGSGRCLVYCFCRANRSTANLCRLPSSALKPARE